MFKRESLETIKAVSEELERLHHILDRNNFADYEDNYKDKVRDKVEEMQDLLILLTKRWNGIGTDEIPNNR